MKPHLNKGQFSNYYLDELLPKEEEFNIPFSHVKTALEETKGVWDKAYLSSLSEPQLRKHFLDKVFENLGWTIDVEPPTPSGEWSKHPDYALFHTRENLKIAQKATREDYFNMAFCIGEAKRWGRPLDRKLKGEKEPFEVQNPSLQISRYLWLTGVRWGFLTDGRYWRIFERETSKRLDVFYEIDLEDLIENGSTEDFKYFYLFFRRDAFPDFLEKVYKESVNYAEAVSEELKENVYQALKTLTQGFLSTPPNKLKETQLKEVHDNSLILLYRLLFILYAEYRGLLPIGENRLYTEIYSLDAIKKEIAKRLDKGEPIATSTYGYWNKLKELFEIINIGNSELGVPPYNGGLFDPEKYDFLERYRIGNLYVAKAVGLLSRSSDRAYIDYGWLESGDERPPADEPGRRRHLTPDMVVQDEIISHFIEQAYLDPMDDAVIDDLVEEFRRRGLDPEALGLSRDNLRQRIIQARTRESMEPREIPVTPQRRSQEARRRLNERSRALANRVVTAIGASINGRNIALAYPEFRSVNNFAAVIQIVNRFVNERLEADVGTRGEIPLERLEEVLEQIDQIGDEVQADVQECLSRR